ncbi:MAG: hypothetical protein IMY86_13205 [Chloroflexi bacterium]|nr:hypothetical protein [Chloroflexota bacterium]
MKSTRREFISYVGVTLASLLTTRCRPTCYTPAAPVPYPPFTPTPNARWATLRECWLDLRNTELQSVEDTDFAIGLRQRHADALDALVTDGELDAAVAEEIGVAFEQAVAHVQRKMATCYIAVPPEFVPRENLVQQAAMLEEMAVESDIAPDTVAQAQAALERDVAWLAQFDAGQVPGTLDEVEVSTESVEAAHILVELLLGLRGYGE